MEWEYAARGGLSSKPYPWGDEITHDYANYLGTGGKDQWGGMGQPNPGTAPVGSFAANGYGLYDMAGNVSEWGADWYGANYYANAPLKNPKGPDTGPYRVFRGSSWGHTPSNLRVALRLYSYPSTSSDYYGFRCVLGFQQ